MSATLDQFKELLETDEPVNMGKLIDIARHGIPAKARGEVWKLLLSVSKFDKSQEVAHVRNQNQEYLEIDKSYPEIKKKIKRHLTQIHTRNEFLQQESIQTKIENVLCAYMNYNTDAKYSYGMISLLTPFVYVLKSESDIFWCFDSLMKKLNDQFGDFSETLSKFMMYLRSVQPDLYNYFEEEELSPNDWAVSWLNFLLSRELPIECVLRLWDTYFASGLSLHVFVCIAIVMNCSEELMELEISELKAFLQHLPMMDMDEIISQAYNVRDEIKSGLIE